MGITLLGSPAILLAACLSVTTILLSLLPKRISQFSSLNAKTQSLSVDVASLCFIKLSGRGRGEKEEGGEGTSELNPQVYKFPQSVKHENWILSREVSSFPSVYPTVAAAESLCREQSLYSKAFSTIEAYS